MERRSSLLAPRSLPNRRDPLHPRRAISDAPPSGSRSRSIGRPIRELAGRRRPVGRARSPRARRFRPRPQPGPPAARTRRKQPIAQLTGHPDADRETGGGEHSRGKRERRHGIGAGGEDRVTTRSVPRRLARWRAGPSRGRTEESNFGARLAARLPTTSSAAFFKAKRPSAAADPTLIHMNDCSCYRELRRAPSRGNMTVVIVAGGTGR